MNQRTAVIVDVQNVYYAVKRYGEKNNQICYPNFTTFLELSKGDIVYAAAYGIELPQVQQGIFLNILKNQGYIIKNKKTNGEKGNLDVEITIGVMCLLDRIDRLLLVSGDGDFLELIKYMQANSIIVDVCSFEGTISKDLEEIADNAYILPYDDSTLIYKS